MAGNVLEWTEIQTEAGSRRVIRSRGWNNPAGSARSAGRDSAPPDDRYDILGFRLVRTGL